MTSRSSCSAPPTGPACSSGCAAGCWPKPRSRHPTSTCSWSPTRPPRPANTSSSGRDTSRPRWTSDLLAAGEEPEDHTCPLPHAPHSTPSTRQKSRGRAPYWRPPPGLHLGVTRRPGAYRLLVTLLRVLEIAGCRNFSATMTRMAMKARMRAYSTMPWPSSARSRSLATRVCAATICLVTNSLIDDPSRNSVLSLMHVTLLCCRAGDTMSDEARAPQRPIGYRLPSNRLTLVYQFPDLVEELIKARDAAGWE